MKLPLPRLSRFGLRTLFVLVTVLAIPLGWIAHEWHLVQERRAVRAWLDGLHDNEYEEQSNNPKIDSNYLLRVDTLELPWHRRLLGDEVIIAWLPCPVNQADQARVFAAFPEAELEPAPGSPAVQQNSSPPAQPQSPAKAQPG